MAPYATAPGFVSTTAGVYHWTADYSGDANNIATSSPCTEEPVTVVAEAHIIVDKVTNPSADPQSFAFTTTGSGYAGFSLTDAAAPNNQVLDPGAYSVAESALAGWDLASASCVSSNQDIETPASISLQAGETVTCTFTNTKKGHLIVQKTTDPALDPTIFTIGASGTGTITGGGAGTVTDATDKNYEVTPGTYSVSETVPSGWDKTGDTCQSVVVGPGETKTCLLTNVKRGHVIIVKDAVPNSAQDFSFTNDFGNSNPSPFSLDDDADPTLGSSRDSEVTPGTYSVSEAAVSGWTQTSAVCSDGSPVTGIVVSPGETVTCTFTNTLQTGHLIVDKITNPAGNATVFNISASGSGTITGGGAGTVTDALNKNYEVTPGTYSVSETIPSGWTQTSNTCSGVVVGPGETKTCVIVNTQVVQYCSPGYWKQSQHFDSYVAPLTPTSLFNTVFGSTAFPGKTLVGVLSSGGGGLTAYGRATVGALLNSASMNSGLTVAQVIAKFNATFGAAPSGNSNGYYGSANPEFSAPENCPLN